MLLLIALFLINMPINVVAKPPAGQEWQLVLNEEFNKPLDPGLWNKGIDNNRISYKRSKCFFLARNVFVKNGNLNLVVKKEKLSRYDKNGKKKKLKYSCGMAQTLKKFRQRYGYFEARIKLPAARGLSTAFWMMPDRSIGKQTPFIKGIRSTKIINDSTEFINGQGMELDIMEYLTQWKRKKIHYAAHWDGYANDLKSHRGYYKPDGKKFADDYHIFALLWQPNLLVWYMNGQEVSRLESSRVSDVASYLILSTNLGGWATWRRETDKMPEKMLVDYVKVWKKADI